MRVVGLLVAAVLFVPSVALSQAAAPGPASSPPIYVCTAAAQVVAITPAATGYTFKVIASGTGSYTGCVIGPDGWLYIANGQTIVRLDVDAAAAAGAPVTPNAVGTGNLFAAPARGLSFNANTMYVTTAVAGGSNSGVYAVNFTEGAPLAFSSVQQLFTTPGDGRGISFDVDGEMMFASGTTIRRSSTPQYAANYLTSSSIATATSAFGVGINPCDNVVYTNPSALSIERLIGSSGGTYTKGATIATFDRKERPNDIRIDPSNRLYVLTGEDDGGTNAKVFILTPATTSADKTGGLETCGSYTKGAPLVELKSRLSGANKIPFLTSASAVGIAIGPSAHRLTHTFVTSLESCSHKFNFGYHSYSVEFTQCPGLTLEITAHKTRPLATTFVANTSVFPFPPQRPVPYSAVGGFATEYQLKPSTQPDTEYLAVLGFFTQKALVIPGVARAADPPANQLPVYTENIGTEFWDIGVLDASGGSRDRDFSWHVVFNSAPPSGARNCTLPQFLDPPMNGTPQDLSPLFNGPQTLSLSFTATGTNCSNALMRVSVARVFGTPPNQTWEPQIVRSNVQTSNIMDSVGNSYKYNLDASALNTDGATAASPALFQITIWGELGVFANYFFEVTKQ